MPSLNNVGKLKYVATPIVTGGLGTAFAYNKASLDPYATPKEKAFYISVRGLAGALGGLAGVELLRRYNLGQIEEHKAFVDELSRLLEKKHSKLQSDLQQAKILPKEEMEAELKNLVDRVYKQPSTADHLAQKREAIESYTPGVGAYEKYLAPIEDEMRHQQAKNESVLNDLHTAYAKLNMAPTLDHNSPKTIVNNITQPFTLSKTSPSERLFRHIKSLAAQEERTRYKDLLKKVPAKKLPKIVYVYKYQAKPIENVKSVPQLHQAIKFNRALRNILEVKFTK